MKRLKNSELEHMSQVWGKASTTSKQEADRVYERLLNVSTTVYFPLGEIMNPYLSLAASIWHSQGKINPEDITEKLAFNAQGLEGCFKLEDVPLSTAILYYGYCDLNRINVFVPNDFVFEDNPQVEPSDERQEITPKRTRTRLPTTRKGDKQSVETEEAGITTTGLFLRDSAPPQ